MSKINCQVLVDKVEIRLADGKWSTLSRGGRFFSLILLAYLAIYTFIFTSKSIVKDIDRIKASFLWS